MRVARHAQVVGAADVGSRLERVAAGQLGHVTHELELILVLFQRAVAPVGVEARPEDEPAIAVPVHVAGRQAGRERRCRGSARESPHRPPAWCRSRTAARRRCSGSSRSGSPRAGCSRTDSRCRTRGSGCVTSDTPPRLTSSRPPPWPERGRPVTSELAAAVPAEGVRARAEPTVDADVERVLVEGLGVGRHVVVAGPVVAPRRVRHRDQRENGLRLRREAVGGDDVVLELRRARPARRSAGRRC